MIFCYVTPFNAQNNIWKQKRTYYICTAFVVEDYFLINYISSWQVVLAYLM